MRVPNRVNIKDSFATSTATTRAVNPRGGDGTNNQNTGGASGGSGGTVTPTVNFYDASIGGPTQWNWTFAKRTTTTGSAGEFSPKLVIDGTTYSPSQLAFETWAQEYVDDYNYLYPNDYESDRDGVIGISFNIGLAANSTVSSATLSFYITEGATIPGVLFFDTLTPGPFLPSIGAPYDSDVDIIGRLWYYDFIGYWSVFFPSDSIIPTGWFEVNVTNQLNHQVAADFYDGSYNTVINVASDGISHALLPFSGATGGVVVVDTVLGTSTEQDPVFTFPSPGTYIATLSTDLDVPSVTHEVIVR